MTEEEAKTKWCPFARSLVTASDTNGRPLAATSANHFPDGKMATCIGSACMAWREQNAGPLYRDELNNPQSQQATGWCGLAGRP